MKKKKAYCLFCNTNANATIIDDGCYKNTTLLGV